MDKNRFENIIAEFTSREECLKQLARALRNVLFPIKDVTLRYWIKRERDGRREIVGKVLVNMEDINKFLFPIWVSAE
jgi:hypothetical protein